MLINDNGASFSNTAGGAVTVTGIADGVNATDAVNFRQLEKVSQQASKGVAMSMAMDSVPQAFNGKSSFGFGLATFNGESAFATGLSHHDDENGTTYNLKASSSMGGEGDKEVAGSVGVGWAF